LNNNEEALVCRFAECATLAGITRLTIKDKPPRPDRCCARKTVFSPSSNRSHHLSPDSLDVRRPWSARFHDWKSHFVYLCGDLDFASRIEVFRVCWPAAFFGIVGDELLQTGLTDVERQNGRKHLLCPSSRTF
jgi:hypothetical protein